MNAATRFRVSVAGWVIAGFFLAGEALAVSPITSIQAHYDSLDDDSEDFAINGAGSGAFPTNTVFASKFTVGTFDNLVIDAFDVSTNNFIFRQLAQRISIVRVDNPTVTGAHHILLYDQEGAIQNTTNINLSSQFAQDMEDILLADIINRGVDNVFCNTGNGDGNNNNIERIDYIFNDGYPAFGNLRKKGFMVMDRGGNDALWINAILGLDTNGNPSAYATPVLLSQTNWGASGLTLDTIVYRGYADDRRPSADVGVQPLTGQYVEWEEFGITTNTLVYGYSLAAADVPATQNWLNVASFPLNTTEGSTAGGLDLMSGGALVLDERLNATLGDYVWNDLDQDGLQDANEPGLSNVLVRVFDVTGTNLAGQTRTDSNGFYMIFALEPDDYRVQVVPPTNYVITRQDVGPDDSIDSDFDTNTGYSGFFSLVSSVTNDAIDAGLYLPPTDLGVSKIVNTNAPRVGTNITYTVALTNFGLYSVDNIQIADLIPAGLIFSNASPSVGTYDSTSGIWSVGTMTNGATARLVITARVDIASGGLSITNTAYVYYADRPDTNTANNTASVVIVVRSVDLGVTKTVSDTLPGVTNMITYQIGLTNNGPDTALGVTVTDVFPAGLTLSNVVASQGTYATNSGLWTVGTLSNGGFASLVFTARVNAGSAGLVITNTATINTTGLGDTNAANDSASATLTVLGADLGVTKIADNYAPYPGSNVLYTITLTNNGPTLATGVTVTERLTNGLTYVSHSASSGTYNNVSGIWTVGTLAANAAVTLQITATVGTNTANTLITNRSTITSSGVSDGNTNNNTDTAIIAVSSLRIRKTSNVSGSVNPGSNITYTIVVTNAGSLTHTNVTITDYIPTGTTYVAGSAQVTGPGVTTNFTLDRFETAAFTNQNGSVSWAGNWTEVGEGDGANAGDVAIVSDGTNRVLRIQDNDNGGEGVRRQVNLGGQTEAYLSFYYRREGLDAASDYVAIYASSNGGTTFAEVGRVAGAATDANYSFSNINISAYIATNTQVRFLSSSTLGGSDIVYFNDARVYWPVGGTNTIMGGTPPYIATNWLLHPGEYLTATFQVLVDNPVAVTQIINTAYSASQSQVLPISDTITNSVSATDLAVTKTVNNPNPNAGSNVVYTITITNNGPLTASSVAVTERLTNGLTYLSHSASRGTYATNTGIWSVGVLTNYTAATLTITARVSTNSIYIGAAITNISTITGSSLADTIPANNTATAIITVGSADLRVGKTVDDNSPLLGSNITYTVTVSNAGPSQATSVTMTDVLPAGLRLLSYSVSQGSFATNTGLWTVGTVSYGGTATLTLNAGVTTTVVGLLITNRAWITSSAQPDPVSSNNTGSVVIITTSADPLGVAKFSSAGGSATNVGLALPGMTNLYTIIVTNPNAFAHTSVRVYDEVPTGMTYVASSTLISAPEYKAYSWYDNFASRLYNNNPGNTNFLSNWDESESGDNPLAGNIQIAYDTERGETYTLQIQGGGVVQSIQRNAGMGGFTNGVLSFEYRRDSLEAGDIVLAQISSNGFAGPWTTLLRLEGPATDAAYAYTNFDIRPWLSTNVGFRFATTNTAMGAGDYVWIDEFRVDAARDEYTTRAGGLPPLLVTNLNLLPGRYATITYEAVVDNPATVTQVVNTAAVTSDQQVAWIYASVTDRVELADIGVGKAASDSSPDEGAALFFTIVATNFGPFAASGLQLTDLLPAGLTYVSNSATAGTFTPAQGVWNIGALAVSNSATLLLHVTVNAGTAGQFLTNRVSVTQLSQGDRNPTNDSATAVIQVVPPFIITDCDFNVTNNAVEIYHHIVNDQQVYDLLYADGGSFSNGLTNVWALADRRAGGKLIDTGSVSRTAPINLPAGVLRYYRISASGFWEGTARRASVQVEAFGVSYLYPGQNWLRPWGIPCNNTVRDIFEHVLPSGSSALTAARVQWYNRSSWIVPATQEVWLASGSTNVWMCSWPEERDNQMAENWPVPYDQGMVVELPTNGTMRKLPMIFGVPTNLQVQTLARHTQTTQYSLVSLNLPEAHHPSQLGLVEAGFKGHAVLPGLSDQIWKFNRSAQVLATPVWYKTSDQTWRLTSTGFPLVPTNYFAPDDALVIVTQPTTSPPMSWTNRFRYTPPTRDINP